MRGKKDKWIYSTSLLSTREALEFLSYVIIDLAANIEDGNTNGLMAHADRMLTEKVFTKRKKKAVRK